MKKLIIDLEQQLSLNAIWKFGINTCHAKLWHRADLPEQLSQMHKELGFGYIRCHGWLNDDMVTAGEDGSWDFSGILKAVNAIRAAGMRPFFELSSMPQILSKNDEKICHYGFLNAPPSDWSRWQSLIRSLVEKLTEHYGEDEISQWYFEVWNEPDIPFWSGTQREYFKLYDLAHAAVKSISPRYRVGGPATSKTAWIPDFCKHVSSVSADDPSPVPRCDFISTHAYPSDLAFLDGADGSVNLQEASLMRRLFSKARAVMDETIGKEVPLICGEWNSSAGPYAWNHDECNNAPFICKIMKELAPICSGSMYWNASDIYEEGGFHYTPFHGGYGLMNVNSLYKASGHAFRFLNQLSGNQVKAEFDSPCEEHGALAAHDGNFLRVLVWNYMQPGKEAVPLEFEFDGVSDVRQMNVELIESGYGSAYEVWRQLGSPDYVNCTTLDKLKRASTPKILDYPQMPFSLKPGTAAMFTFVMNHC